MPSILGNEFGSENQENILALKIGEKSPVREGKDFSSAGGEGIFLTGSK